MTTKRRLIILEGCDGTGKTTLGLKLAQYFGAHYVHLDAMPAVTGRGLPRMSLEAMTPALLGHRPVVMDRCWLSEIPYGVFLRNGDVRIADFDRSMLDRLALSCDAVVVRCSTDLDKVLNCWEGRQEEELIKKKAVVTKVWNWYRDYLPSATCLPIIDYDYQRTQIFDLVSTLESRANDPSFYYQALSQVGSLKEEAVLLVDSCKDRVSDFDSIQRWPGVAFGPSSYSRYVANHLIYHGIRESDVAWTTVDYLTELVAKYPQDLFKRMNIVCLGGDVFDCVEMLVGTGRLQTFEVAVVQHPADAAATLKSHDSYDLGSVIKQQLNRSV